MGIDYGTGGAKAVVIDGQGEVLGYAFEEYPIITSHPGWSEHDPYRYWQIACRIIRKTVTDAGIAADEIRGIAVSSALPSLVMVDKNHEPIHNAYNLMDRRATEEVQWLKDNIGEDRIFEISKNRLDDHPVIVNLMWEKHNRPDSFRKIHKALAIDGFITMRLTGQFTCHYSGAAFYGVAYNLLERHFDEDVLKEIGIPGNILPELYPCNAIIGEVTAQAAEETGLSAGIPVAAGQADCNAGWVGAGAIEIGDIQMNLGTCGNFGIIHRGAEFHNSMISFSYTTDSKNTYITVPTTTTGGQLIRYMRDNFYIAEKKQEQQTGIDTYDLINREAENIPAGSEGLVVLPFLMGERTPIWDVYARGTIFGLSMNHTRGHVIKAMMESVAYALYDSFLLIEEDKWKINTPIVLNEGGAKSVLWRKIITDVFNVPTVLVKRRIGAPYGDAILAGVASGVFRDFSVARDWAEYIEPMEPDAANHKIYTEYFDLYKTLYSHVKQDFRKLAELRMKK
ncbi:MAG: FGGY-family carbohydrate kinase [Sedimentisphaerales bacterium]|nr:FGGY-family carbohydrate kinase [Sedimentisphaerales bacterium]